jgi:membrane-bound ClpP family serine protease
MDTLGALQFVAVVVTVLGVALALLGFLPPTRARFGDTTGWGVTLLVLGFVMLLLVWIIPMMVG